MKQEKGMGFKEPDVTKPWGGVHGTWGGAKGNIFLSRYNTPDIKVYGAIMGPTWSRQDPGGPCVGPMDLASWDG